MSFGKLYMCAACRLYLIFGYESRLEVFRFYTLNIASQKVFENGGLVVWSFKDLAFVVFDWFAVNQLAHV